MVTYQPDLYDAVTPASFQGDLEWYRCKALESGGPVLELGAGTGRVTLAIAEAGPTIYAPGERSCPDVRRTMPAREVQSAADGERHDDCAADALGVGRT